MIAEMRIKLLAPSTRRKAYASMLTGALQAVAAGYCVSRVSREAEEPYRSSSFERSISRSRSLVLVVAATGALSRIRSTMLRFGSSSRSTALANFVVGIPATLDRSFGSSFGFVEVFKIKMILFWMLIHNRLGPIIFVDHFARVFYAQR